MNNNFQLDPTKSARQEKGINIWKEHGYRGTLNYIMRFGKTRIIELVCQKIKVNPNHNDKRILILVPTEIALENVKYICNAYNVESYTYNTYYNLIQEEPNQECFVLIIDEIHKFLSDKAINLILKTKAKFKLGLTGSKIDSNGKNSLKRIGFPIIDIITEEEAIEMNWITDYDEYNVAVEISDNQKQTYKSLNDNIDSIGINFKYIYNKVNTAFGRLIFKNDYEVIQSCYSGKKVFDSNFKLLEFIAPDVMREIVAALMGYERGFIITNNHENTIQTYWNPDNIEAVSKSYIKSVTARNNYMKHNINKVNAVLAMSKKINRPTIVYNDSIEMIDQLYSTLSVPRVKYHSSMESVPMTYDNGEIITYLSGDKKGQVKLFGKTTIKKQAIERIKSGQALYLITGKSLSESLNLPNIEFIICTSGDTNATTYDQRVARGKTIDNNNVDKRCTIINIFIDDFYLNGEFIRSRDKEKLISRQSNIKNVIWLDNVEELFGTINNIL